MNKTYLVTKNHPNGNASLLNDTIKAIKEASEQIIKDNEEKEWKICKDKPFSAALIERGWNPDTGLKKTVEWLIYDFDYAVKPKYISTRHFSGLPTENAFVTSSKGYVTVLDYLAKNFTDKIKTNKVVNEIKYSSDGVEVKTNDGDIYKANYTLCTFSTGVLDSDLVKFVPELPAWKNESIKKIPLAYYTHIFVKFPVAFWDDASFLLEGGENRGIFSMAYNLNNKKFHPGSNILLFTAIGDDAIRVESQSENATIDQVIEVLEVMYPNKKISRPTEIFVSKWSKNLYVGGSYSNAIIGSTLAHFHNLEGRVNNLFFSGEACDEEYWGNLQGAYFTGLRQAKAIVSCFQGNTCEAYQPESTKPPCPSAGHSLHSREIVMVFISLVAIFKLI